MAAKFAVGQRVRIVLLLDSMSSRNLVGMEGIIKEMEPLPNGDYNYWVDGHYMHEGELELVE